MLKRRRVVREIGNKIRESSQKIAKDLISSNEDLKGIEGREDDITSQLKEKLTELGTDQMVPLITSRGVAEATESARTRLERAIVEACKQCGRNTLMSIRAPASLQALPELFPSQKKLIAHPDGYPLTSHSILNEQACLIAIGPEGGFTTEELDVAATLGFYKVSLGPHILRVETAAVTVASWMSQVVYGT